MANIREIAKSAGVSITTVSRVLNNHPAVKDELRDRVLAEVNRSRYAAAASRSDVVNVGLVYLGNVTAAEMLTSPFDIALLQGMAEGMRSQDYNLVVLDAGGDRHQGESFTQMAHRRGIRAAILRGASRDRQECRAIAEEGFPAIAIAEAFPPDSPVSFVRSDSRPASLDAVRRLIELGHRRIAICLHRIADDDHVDRFEAYTQAHEEAGLACDPALRVTVNATREGGAQFIHRLQALPEPPTAAFITDPLVSVAAIHAALRSGLHVPDDLSIVGFDDAQLRLNTYPPMAAVCQDARLLGKTAVDAALLLLADADAPPQRHILRTWFESHPSIAAPTAAQA